MNREFDAPYNKPDSHANLTARPAGKTPHEVVYEMYCVCLDFLSGKWRDNDGTAGDHKYYFPEVHETQGNVGLENQWLGK